MIRSIINELFDVNGANANDEFQQEFFKFIDSIFFYLSGTLELVERNQMRYSELFGFEINIFKFFYYFKDTKIFF